MTKVLVVTGPTATGKTALGVRLAKALGGEVVSADSMQVYKYMDVGTAKPTEEEMQGVPHHMIGVAEPTERYSVSEYVPAATKCVEDIASRGRVPIIVGGTGLYVESLILGRDFADEGSDSAERERLYAQYDALGGEKMLSLLAQYDPERAAKLHPNDKKRVVRALEVALAGSTITAHDEETKTRPPKYDARIVVLNWLDRAKLYERINLRVDEMMERGLPDEVRRLMDMGFEKSTALQAIGYKELCEALRGECSVEDAVGRIKLGSRRYAKRQISWNTRYSEAFRINWENFPNIDDALHASTEFFQK